MYDAEKLQIATIIANEVNQKAFLDRMIDSRPKGKDAETEWFHSILDNIKSKNFDPELKHELMINIIRIISEASNKHEEKIKDLVAFATPGLHYMNAMKGHNKS